MVAPYANDWKGPAHRRNGISKYEKDEKDGKQDSTRREIEMFDMRMDYSIGNQDMR